MLMAVVVEAPGGVFKTAVTICYFRSRFFFIKTLGTGGSISITNVKISRVFLRTVTSSFSFTYCKLVSFALKPLMTKGLKNNIV